MADNYAVSGTVKRLVNIIAIKENAETGDLITGIFDASTPVYEILKWGRDATERAPGRLMICENDYVGR